MAGALKGFGEGLHESGQDRMEAEAAAAKQTHDDARAEALIRLKARLDSEARKEEYAQQTSMQELKGTQAEGLQKGEQAFKGKEAEATRQFEAVQTDKKLESAEKVARIGAEAKEGAQKNKAWKLTKIKGQSTFDPATNTMTEGEERVAITSPKLGLTFVQEGDIFKPQSKTDQMRQPKDPAGALKKLRENPKEYAQSFLQAYKWLPSDVVPYLLED